MGFDQIPPIKMKKRLLTLAALAAITTSFSAAAAGTAESRLDVYGFVGAANLKISNDTDSFKADGVDLGARAVFNVTPNLFLLGEYTYADADGDAFGTTVKIKVDEARGGAGFRFEVAPGLKLGVFGQYVYQQTSFGADGFSISADYNGYHVGGSAQYDIIPQLQGFGRVGYLTIEDDGTDGSKLDGLDLNAGLSYRFTPNLGIYIEYRYSGLSTSDNTDFDYNSFRGGVKLPF